MHKTITVYIRLVLRVLNKPQNHFRYAYQTSIDFVRNALMEFTAGIISMDFVWINSVLVNSNLKIDINYLTSSYKFDGALNCTQFCPFGPPRPLEHSRKVLGQKLWWKMTQKILNRPQGCWDTKPLVGPIASFDFYMCETRSRCHWRFQIFICCSEKNYLSIKISNVVFMKFILLKTLAIVG